MVDIGLATQYKHDSSEEEKQGLEKRHDHNTNRVLAYNTSHVYTKSVYSSFINSFIYALTWE